MWANCYLVISRRQESSSASAVSFRQTLPISQAPSSPNVSPLLHVPRVSNFQSGPTNPLRSTLPCITMYVRSSARSPCLNITQSLAKNKSALFCNIACVVSTPKFASSDIVLLNIADDVSSIWLLSFLIGRLSPRFNPSQSDFYLISFRRETKAIKFCFESDRLFYSV